MMGTKSFSSRAWEKEKGKRNATLNHCFEASDLNHPPVDLLVIRLKNSEIFDYSMTLRRVGCGFRSILLF